MLLNGTGGYTRGGSQFARGDFLIITGGYTFPDGGGGMVKLPLRAAVRNVRMSQLGHWMMATARVGKDRVFLSGSYGSNGLPCDPSKFPHAYGTMLPLPAELEAKFWSGGGHNTAGTEGPSLRAWAKANLIALRKAGR